MTIRPEEQFDGRAAHDGRPPAGPAGGLEPQHVDESPAAHDRDAPGDVLPPDLSPEPALRALRRLDVSSSMSLLFLTLLLLPISYAYASLLALPLGQARTWVVVGYFLLGLCLLIRPIEARVMRVAFRVRRPADHELDRLWPVWSTVLAQAEIDGDRYVLAIDDRAEPNALAVGGHVVAVTLGALHLSDHELEGILAHELGHHLGFHPLALTASFWLSLPLVAVAAIAYRLLRFTRVSLMAGWFLGLPVLMLFSWLFALIFGLLARLLGLVLALTNFALNLIGRSAEYAADHVAVELGFGQGLAAALETHAATSAESTTATEWLWRSHPPLHKRIRRIRDALERTGGWAAGSDG